MRMNRTMNMTEGQPLRLLAVFALPLLVGNLFQQAYTLADSMIVGQLLGANALAAVGATGSVSFLFFSLFNGISGGCSIVTAKYFGAGDTFFSFINGIVEIIGRVGPPILLLRWTDLGVWTIWLTAGMTWLLSGIACVFRYMWWKGKNAGR